MKIILYSDPIKMESIGLNNNTYKVKDEIHLITQYYVNASQKRQLEIDKTLQENNTNSSISKIHLLNEKYYDFSYLNSTKIIQTCINKRLSFDSVFRYIKENDIQGYIVIANADIFFDDSLLQLHNTTLSSNKEIICQLRYEFKDRYEPVRIFGPRYDSQDTWIIHSNHSILLEQCKVFNFCFGVPGCDNKLIYLFKILGYTLYNDPLFIRTYHNHNSQIRNYVSIIDLPYGYIVPYNYPNLCPSLGYDVASACKKSQTISFDDNIILYNYINKKIKENVPFIIPRIAGVENNLVIAVKLMRHNNTVATQKYCIQLLHHMSYNAGVHFSNFESIMQYSSLYLKAFINCELLCSWDLQGEYIKHVFHSHNEMMKLFQEKTKIWAFTLDIFHYIYSNPWTQSLRGKRILIVSPFETSMKNQLPHLNKIYDNVDLFPECTFVFIKPPMTQGSEESLDFQIELSNFYLHLDKLKNDYDIALVSSGGYGNIICNYIYENHNKSAIYVGGVLQMFFGILGERWVRERHDIITLYHNKYWIRPDKTERPRGYTAIEESCYW